MSDVTRGTRTLYGLGSVAEGTKDAAFNVFLLFYYNNVLGLPGSLAGLAIFLSLCADALVDPLIGSVSDRTRTRWGRRHPYMYAAAVPLPVLFWLVFAPPPGLGSTALFAWLTATAILLRASLSLYAVASNALAPELARRYDERTEVLAHRFLYGWLAGLSIALLGYTVFFAAGPGGDSRMDADSYAGFGLFCGIVAAAGVLVCAGGTHRLIPALRGPLPSQQGGGRFWREMRDVLSVPSFRALFGSVLFSAAAWGYLQAIGYYINTFFWGLAPQQIGALSLGMFVSVFLAFALAPALSGALDKRRFTIFLKLIGVVAGPAPIALRLLGWLPENGTAMLMTILFCHTLFVTALVVAGQIVRASMLADITDEGELLHRERREGLYAAVLVFGIQASSGLGGLLAGVSLDVVEFPRQLGIAAVPAGVIDTLGYVAGAGTALLFLGSALCLLGYRITRDRHREIQHGLELRHG
jgi:glycoside/pentoside/hexuronide:cation symporter, GPH family